MKKQVGFVLTLASLVFAGDVKHHFIANGFAKGVAAIVTTDGSIEWQLSGLPSIQDSWKLENGNYLFSYKTGVKEVAPDKTVAWEYNSPAGVELHSAQPLENGNVLACECGTKRLIEIECGTGKIVKEIPLQSNAKPHMQFRTARKTSHGTYWVAFFGESKVKEIDESGTVLREWKTGTDKNQAHGLQPLPNGNLLASTAYGQEVKEFDPQGNVVWYLTEQDQLAAGVITTGYTASVERLANGNTLVSLYHGEPQIFEITPDKKIVWQFYDESLGNVAGIRLLD